MKDALPIVVNKVPPIQSVVKVVALRIPRLLPDAMVVSTYSMTMHRSEVSTSTGYIEFRGQQQHASAMSNAYSTLLSCTKEFSTTLNKARENLRELAAFLCQDMESLERILVHVRGRHTASLADAAIDDDLYGNPAPVAVDSSGEEEAVNQLVQDIVDRSNAKTLRSTSDQRGELLKTLERSSKSTTPHTRVMKVLADHWDVCSHCIEMYFEILPRGETGSVATDSRKAAAQRIWVFVTCKKATVYRMNLDHALDRIIARNNAPVLARVTKTVVPACSYTRGIRMLHPDLTETLLLPYSERCHGCAPDVISAINNVAFVDPHGQSVTELNNKKLRSVYKNIGLDTLFGKHGIAREPVSGNSAQHLAQSEVYTYISGLHPDAFPDDFEEACKSRYEYQVVQVSRARAALSTLRHSQSIARTELQTANSDDYNRQVERLGQISDEIIKIDALIVAAYVPLDSYTRSAWDAVGTDWHVNGITLHALPEQVRSDCFWQVTNLSSMLPPLLYSSFIGHWENIQNIRCRRPEGSTVYRAGVMGGVDRTLTNNGVDLIPAELMPHSLLSLNSSADTRILNDFTVTTLHEFTEEHLPTLKAFLIAREQVLAHKLQRDALPQWSTRLRQFASDLLNNVAHQAATDSVFRKAVTTGASDDPMLHLFGENRLRPENEASCRQDPTIEAGDEAVQYIMCTAASGLNLGFTQLPFLVMWLITLDSCICRSSRSKTHFILTGDADCGKSHLLSLIESVSLEGMFVAGGKESNCAAYSESADDSGLVGCKAYHEAPKAIKNYKAGKEGKECDENDEIFKHKMSEGRVNRSAAGLATTLEGKTVLVTTETRKWAKLTHFIMTNDPLSKIDPSILSRCVAYVVDQIISVKKSPANYKVSENAEGGVGISGTGANNKDVYSNRFTEFTQRNQLLALMHGAMRIFAPGVLPPSTQAMNHVYGAFEHVVQLMGSEKRPTRAVAQAMSVAESIMQLRVYYEDSRRYGPVSAGTLGTNLERFYTKRRTSELRQILSVSDCIKAVGLILANDRIHDVLRVLDAIIGLLEAGKVVFSELFMEPGNSSSAPPVFSSDGVRVMRFSKHVQTGENTMSSFAKLLVPYASGMNAERMVRTLHELERSHSLRDYSHGVIDMTLGVDSGTTYSGLDAEEMRESDPGLFGKLTCVDNFERRGNLWREIRKDKSLPLYHQLLVLPYEQEIKDRAVVTPFVSVDSFRGEVRICTAAVIHRLCGKLTGDSGMLRKMCDRLSDSTTTSRFVGFTPSGMSGVDPAAPQLLQMTYLRHNADRHDISLNPQFVASSMHNWMAPGVVMPGICNQVTTALLPNVPLDLQFAMQHIQRAAEIDHNVFPGAHQVYDADPLGFLIMAPHWARGIIDLVGENEAQRLWLNATPSTERRAVIREYLSAPPELGGYRDFMRHYCPWRSTDLDPDHELSDDGDAESKTNFLNFLERTVADLERSMSMLDEATLPEASIPQTETSTALRKEIERIQSMQPDVFYTGSSMSLKLQALQTQLALVEVDRIRVMDNIHKGRHTKIRRPLPFAWVETRERLNDRPGVHSGAGYCAYVRKWAMKMTERRKDRWGALVSHE
jgi:hypothetical protein